MPDNGTPADRRRVIYDSPDDKDSTVFDAGQALAGLAGNILEMTDQPQASQGKRCTRLVFVHQRPSPSVFPAPTSARPMRTSA